MNIKILKNKVTIELTTNEYDDMFKYINKLRSMLSTLHETNDLWLSDVHNLDSLQYDLVKLLDAKWDAGSYRYVKRGQSK